MSKVNLNDHTVEEWERLLNNGAVDPTPELIAHLTSAREIFPKHKTDDFLPADAPTLPTVSAADAFGTWDPTEQRIQAEMFQWFHNTYPHLRGLLYHVPNGGKRDKVTASLLTASGVVAGIPDLVFHYQGNTYFIEVKKPGEHPTPVQESIHKTLDAHGFPVWVLDNLAAFQGVIIPIVSEKGVKTTPGLSREDFFYRNGVFTYLYSLSHGDKTIINDICELESQGKFRNYIYEFITGHYGQIEGFEIIFSEDKTYFYREDLDK